jgi:hypothetical protein
MSRLRVALIVEGHGEVQSVRILLGRIWRELLGGAFIDVIQPIRQPRGKLVRKEDLQGAVRLALKKLNNLPPPNDPSLVLILLDADADCPKELGPKLCGYAREVNSRADMACVLAKVEYETWFAAAAESLSNYLDLTSHSSPSESPEESRHGKSWVEQRFKGAAKYSETQDQPAMTSAMDLDLCRRRAPSFDKLCRDLEQRLRRPTPSD